MNTLLLSIIAASALPTPHFAPGLPLPAPRFGPLPTATLVVARPPVDRTMQFDSKGRLIRLPGPKNWYRCPQCGSSTDLMYLGQHVRGVHRKSNSQINKVGYQSLATYHDNLHNVNWKPPPPVKVQAVRPSTTTCQGGSCRFPRARRFFGGR